jgi:hypothetical protein
MDRLLDELFSMGLDDAFRILSNYSGAGMPCRANHHFPLRDTIHRMACAVGQHRLQKPALE